MNIRKFFKPSVTQLRDMLDRASWIREIEDTRGYRLITTIVDREIAWTLDELKSERDLDTITQLQGYCAALEFIRDAIFRWKRDGEAANEILTGRAKEIDKITFSQSVSPESLN